MNDVVRLDPDDMRNHGARMSELGDRVGRTYAGLRDALAQADGSWGDDDLGLSFATEFKPHADELLANLRAMEESLHNTAAGIMDAADEFGRQDIDVASRLAAQADGPAFPSAEQGPVSAAGGAGAPSSMPEGAAENGAAMNGSAGNGSGGNGSAGQGAPGARGDGPAGQSPAARSQTPDPSGGQQAEPDGGRREPGASDRSAGREGRGESGRATHDPGRRPPPSGVSPPAGDGRRAPRAPGASAGVSSGGARSGSPWTGPPKTPSAPQPGEQRPSSPRSGPPPRPRKPAGEPPRRNERRGSGDRPVSHPVVRWLARTLAERHGVRVAGFDTPGLVVESVRGFVAAVDRVLTDYPAITLDVVAIADLGEGATVRWRSEPLVSGPRAAPPAGTGRSITLDLRTAQEPSGISEHVEPEAAQLDPEIYAATVRELARALDFAGGGFAGRNAQRVLIEEYARLETDRRTSLVEVLRGYQRWRAALDGNDTAAGGFDVGRALGVAFAEVVLHGDRASVQARTLHSVLAGAAARQG
ncbi:hypothetical protein BJY24_000074 [Nocardia transvalensis]|uniref:WXG100 family type VII secretion target n=1 Tax=Nocardia transvalensis TaxID=37333 RepID=A0A7W9UFK5_9NOCA|nr:hypothetical protein [Nocardia transvalensis]MBB5911207.1 hypothetical protein [Nocardia transvalensis]